MPRDPRPRHFWCNTPMRSAVSAILLSVMVGTSPRAQEPVIVDTPSVTVLRGLTVPQFEAEMQLMNQALGVSCGFCHARGNFAADTNPRKATARRMIEMVRAIDQQCFPDHRPADGESRLGQVTCFTCHQGSERPKSAPPQ
jgi:Photosynthetic reaction centre cytochrome C subunit